MELFWEKENSGTEPPSLFIVPLVYGPVPPVMYLKLLLDRLPIQILLPKARAALLNVLTIELGLSAWACIL